MSNVVRSPPLAQRLTAACPATAYSRCAAWRRCCRTAARSVLFRLADDTIRAVEKHRPDRPGGGTVARIVGDRGGVPVVQSPLKKQAFSLLDRRRLDAEGVSIPVYATRVGVDGTVWVANSPTSGSATVAPACPPDRRLARRRGEARRSDHPAARRRRQASRITAGCRPSGEATTSASAKRRRL